MLNRVRVVLVATRSPGNIGAAARAMKTMGLSDLALVSPQRFPDPEAAWMAASAQDILSHTRIYQNLHDALADCRLAIAVSARERRSRWPCLDPEQAAQRLLDHTTAGPVALVFGPEASGLTSEQVYACRYRSAIASDPACRSLNLAQAVQIYAYALWQRHDQVPMEDKELLATHTELEYFYGHLSQVLIALNDPQRNVRLLLQNLKAIFNRADLSPRDVSLLHGVLSRIERRIASL